MSETLKSMSLYVDLESRVLRELRNLGYGDADKVPANVLSRFDQLHYGGTDAVHQSIVDCQIRSGHHVLEVGSGLGGPARYLADATECRVTALELQQELHEAGERLTDRCQLGAKVRHRCGDILVDALEGRTFDALVSWLVFLHIPHRTELFAACFRRLRPGGVLFLEDYAKRNELTPEESLKLAREVKCPYLPTIAAYVGEVEAAGFEILRVENMSKEWTKFVQTRDVTFRDRKSELLNLHGESDFNRMCDFHSAVSQLFRGGNLGGLRLTARKPAQN